MQHIVSLATCLYHHPSSSDTIRVFNGPTNWRTGAVPAHSLTHPVHNTVPAPPVATRPIAPITPSTATVLHPGVPAQPTPFLSTSTPPACTLAHSPSRRTAHSPSRRAAHRSCSQGGRSTCSCRRASMDPTTWLACRPSLSGSRTPVAALNSAGGGLKSSRSKPSVV